MDVYIFANIYDQDLRRKRGLRAAGSAAINRVAGLALSLSCAGRRVEIITSGIAGRPTVRALLHRSEEVHHRGIRVKVNAAVGLPIVGIAFAPLFYLNTLFQLAGAGSRSTAIFYNYGASSFLMILLLRFSGVTTCVDLEDVTLPSRGWRPLRRLRSLWGWLNMQACLFSCHKVIIPADSFRSWVPREKPVCVARYFAAEEERGHRSECGESSITNILYSGPYVAPHGVDLVIGALKYLANHSLDRSCRFHFTGIVPSWFIAQVREAGISERGAVFHGFLSEQGYRDLLFSCDVGLALQLRSDRYAVTNVPSKAYEYMAAGLLPIVCAIGDFRDSLKSHVVVLAPETHTSLARLLEDIIGKLPSYRALRDRNSAWSRREWGYEVQGERISQFLVN